MSLMEECVTINLLGKYYGFVIFKKVYIFLAGSSGFRAGDVKVHLFSRFPLVFDQEL
jgi:hypothetical protein